MRRKKFKINNKVVSILNCIEEIFNTSDVKNDIQVKLFDYQKEYIKELKSNNDNDLEKQFLEESGIADVLDLNRPPGVETEAEHANREPQFRQEYLGAFYPYPANEYYHPHPPGPDWEAMTWGRMEIARRDLELQTETEYIGSRDVVDWKREGF